MTYYLWHNNATNRINFYRFIGVPSC